jgi:hypothetical protein
MKPSVVGVAALLLFSTAGAASADPASIGVGSGRDFARPPVVVVRDDTPQPTIYEEETPRRLPKDPYRSAFRLSVGPAVITSGQGIGPGLWTAADFGSGVVGFRLSAAWFRGDAPDDPASRLGSRVGLYSGELTLDLRASAPLHVVFGLGLGAVDLGKETDAWAIAGLGRVGLEYSLGLEEADARIGAGLTGGLLGPLDQASSNAQGFAAMTWTFSIGF